MKFVTAHQNVEDLVAELENYIQSGTFHANNLVVVTLESHASDLKSMVPIEVETVKESDFDENKPLNHHGLDEKTVELYDDVLRNGGYVVLQKDEKHGVTDNRSADSKPNSEGSNDVELHAPGFGVDIDDPDSSAENHEDNFNPDNPNPQAVK
ncbi:MAG: hypothetical protein JJU01_01045 [Alkalibacterium sp.]|nr:hypothetical protein [Alkalibacterium sp.]